MTIWKFSIVIELKNANAINTILGSLIYLTEIKLFFVEYNYGETTIYELRLQFIEHT